MGQVGIQLRASGRAAEDTRLRPRRMTCHAASESTLSGRLNAPGMRATSTRGGVTSVLAYPDRRRRQTLGVILSIVLIAAGLVQPATTFAGGPTPSPDATASPTQPPIDPESNPVGPEGAGVLAETPQPCGTAGPGQISVGFVTDMNAVVIDASAFETSHFYLETSTEPGTPTPQLVINDATHSEGGGYAEKVETDPDSQILVFSIHTPTFGQVRRSDSQFAKVLQEAAGVWLICFEDGNDNDFNDLVVRAWDAQCGNQQLLDPYPDPVHVKYDPRSLGDVTELDFLQQATLASEGILDRAFAARAEMSNLFDAFEAGTGSEVDGYPIEIEVNCSGSYGGASGYTQDTDLIKLRPDFMRQSMRSYVLARRAGLPQAIWPIAGESWADLIDHELFHTYQAHAIGGVEQFIRYHGFHDYVNIESTAMVGQDLLADSDDLDDLNDESYLHLVGEGIADPAGAPIVFGDHPRQVYRAGAFFQWLGERYGTGPNLEARVAQFAREVYDNNAVRLVAIGNAIGGDKQTALDAIRDYWVTMLVSEANNLADWPNEFRLLDESTLHGQPADFGGPDPALKYPLVVRAGGANGFTLPMHDSPEVLPTTPLIRRYDVPEGTALLKLTITDNSDPVVVSYGMFATTFEPDPVRIAALPTLANLDVVFEPSYFTGGPERTKTETYTFAAAGMDTITLVLLAGETTAKLDLDVSAVAGSLSMTVGPVFTFGDSLIVRARPAVGSVFARQQPQAAYTVKVDGVLQAVKGVVDLGDGATIVLRGASSLSTGQHEVEVTFQLGTQSVTTTATFEVPGSLAGMSLLDASSVDLPIAVVGGSALAGDPLELAAVPVSDQGPVVGAMVTATVVDPFSVSRSFVLTDHGSPLDGASGDGAFAAEAFGTSATGTYAVTFEATGEIDGVPFSTSRTTSFEVGAGADADADGISDAMEVRLGLDPNSAADGSTDLDLDGAGTAVELARGSNPMTSDTDGAGEADGSEIANGADPLSAADDAVIPSVGATATAIDGRVVEVRLELTPDTGSARVFRVQNGVSTDLGLRTGDQTFMDGPLTVGTYSYRVVGETASGRRGSVAGIGPVEARDDATAPQATLAVTGGKTVTNQPSIPLHFNGVTGAPTQMRLAETTAALEVGPWVPFLSDTTFDVANTDGPHTIRAELRDAAGNILSQLTQVITMDLNPPTSIAGPLPPYTLGNTTSVPYVASDDRDVGIVELWKRSRATPAAPWSGWTSSGMGASPIFLGLSDGYYQFATVAVDRAGNREALPAVGDAEIRVGPETVNDDLGSAFQGQAQATNGRDGTIGLVWSDNRNSATITDIYFARRQDATFTWGTNERVDDAAVGAVSPSVAIDASGNVYVAWVDSRRGGGDAGDVYVAKRSAATGLWAPGVLINDDAVGAAQSSPSIAVSETGEVIVVWADRRNNKQHIYSARLPAGSSTWSADIKVTSDQTKVKTVPSVAIGSDGTAYILWQQAANKNGIWFSSLPLGSSTWATPAQINDNSKDQINPRIAVDTAGRLLAVYSEGTTAIWARTRPGGSSTWSTAVVVSTSTPGSARTPAVSMRGNGVGYVVWTTTAGVMWGVRFDPATGTWGSQTQLSASGVYARPAVAMTSTLGIAAGEVGSGSAANLRAYPATVP